MISARKLYLFLLLLSIGIMIFAFIEGDYAAALPATYGVLTSAKELLNESEGKETEGDTDE